MFEGDLTTLSTPDLLESAAEHRAEANRVDARLLEHAQIYADRHHPDRCPTRPGRSPGDGRERADRAGRRRLSRRSPSSPRPSSA